MKHTVFLLVCLILCLTPMVSAITTEPVTNITAGTVVFHGSGSVSPCWFSWGYGTNLYWTTPNQSVNGDFSDTQFGSPMMSGTSYYVKACDSTGCGAAVSFDVPKSSPINSTYFGTGALTIMRSGFNVYTAASLVLTPYGTIMDDTNTGTVSSTSASFIWGIFFSFVFIGYWLRGKGIMLPAILAIMSGIVLVASPIQVDPIFLSMGFPLLAIGLAGVFVSWISNK